jgi:membrane protease YdiL (CAAX protease family)
MNDIENAKGFIETVNLPDFILCLSGSLLFGYWLLRTSLGTRALEGSRSRRNRMPLFLPFVLMFVSYFLVALAGSIAPRLAGDFYDSHRVIFENLVMCITGFMVIIIIILSVRPFFARQLKGFGLNFKTIHKDLPAAFVNLIAIWPLIMAAATLTLVVCNLLFGPDFQMPRHEGLEKLSENPQLPPRILITMVAVIVAPLLEELLFRGLFQTMIRSFLNVKYSAWLAIAISSVLFVTMHADISHWPALFVLGAGMGYSYEKSGSLFQPIFIHMLFNATSIISVWIQ